MFMMNEKRRQVTWYRRLRLMYPASLAKKDLDADKIPASLIATPIERVIEQRLLRSQVAGFTTESSP